MIEDTYKINPKQNLVTSSNCHRDWEGVSQTQAKKMPKIDDLTAFTICSCDVGLWFYKYRDIDINILK